NKAEIVIPGPRRFRNRRISDLAGADVGLIEPQAGGENQIVPVVRGFERIDTLGIDRNDIRIAGERWCDVKAGLVWRTEDARQHGTAWRTGAADGFGGQPRIGVDTDLL